MSRWRSRTTLPGVGKEGRYVRDSGILNFLFYFILLLFNTETERARAPLQKNALNRLKLLRRAQDCTP
jgi:hypothetical protein